MQWWCCCCNVVIGGDGGGTGGFCCAVSCEKLVSAGVVFLFMMGGLPGLFRLGWGFMLTLAFVSTVKG